MKRAWKILIAGVIFSAVLLPGMAGAQGGGIQISKAGDIVTISGQTNLAVGDRLLINVVSAGFTPTVKGTGGGFAGAAGSVTVQPGSPLNTYSFDVNVSTFPPREIPRHRGVRGDPVQGFSAVRPPLDPCPDPEYRPHRPPELPRSPYQRPHLPRQFRPRHHHPPRPPLMASCSWQPFASPSVSSRCCGANPDQRGRREERYG